MPGLKIYKPNSKFPARIGAAFQFDRGIKNSDGPNPTPCLFITAALQTKAKPAQISKESAFVWADPNTKKPDAAVIRFCCDLNDLTRLLVVLEGNHYKIVGQNREWLGEVQLTHKWTPQGGKERTTSFRLDHSDKTKDMIMSLSRNPGHKGTGFDKIGMYLQPHEQVALRELVRNVVQAYYNKENRS
jgi:hypothetical protein